MRWQHGHDNQRAHWLRIWQRASVTDPVAFPSKVPVRYLACLRSRAQGTPCKVRCLRTAAAVHENRHPQKHDNARVWITGEMKKKVSFTVEGADGERCGEQDGGQGRRNDERPAHGVVLLPPEKGKALLTWALLAGERKRGRA